MKRQTIIWMAIFYTAFFSFSACDNGAEQTDEETTEVVTGDPFATINAALKEDPDNPDLYMARAQTYYELEGYDEAIADLEKAMMMDSTQPAYYHLLSKVYLDYFKSYQALKTLELAAARFPENLPTLLRLARLQYTLKKYRESFATIDKILKQDPQNATAYFLFGMNFKEQGDTARAINSFQRAVEIEPDMADAWMILGQLFEAQENPIAEKYFNNAIRVDSTNVNVLHAKAVYLTNTGQPQKALGLYKKINILAPQYEEAYLNAGLIYMEQDSLDKAFRQFDLLVKVSPISIGGYYYRGLASELKGNLKAAREDFKQVLKFAPSSELANEALERVNEQLQ